MNLTDKKNQINQILLSTQRENPSYILEYLLDNDIPQALLDDKSREIKRVNIDFDISADFLKEELLRNLKKVLNRKVDDYYNLSNVYQAFCLALDLDCLDEAYEGKVSLYKKPVSISILVKLSSYTRETLASFANEDFDKIYNFFLKVKSSVSSTADIEDLKNMTHFFEREYDMRYGTKRVFDCSSEEHKLFNISGLLKDDKELEEQKEEILNLLKLSENIYEEEGMDNYIKFMEELNKVFDMDTLSYKKRLNLYTLLKRNDNTSFILENLFKENEDPKYIKEHFHYSVETRNFDILNKKVEEGIISKEEYADLILSSFKEHYETLNDTKFEIFLKKVFPKYFEYNYNNKNTFEFEDEIIVLVIKKIINKEVDLEIEDSMINSLIDKSFNFTQKSTKFDFNLEQFNYLCDNKLIDFNSDFFENFDVYIKDFDFIKDKIVPFFKEDITEDGYFSSYSYNDMIKNISEYISIEESIELKKELIQILIQVKEKYKEEFNLDETIEDENGEEKNITINDLKKESFSFFSAEEYIYLETPKITNFESLSMFVKNFKSKKNDFITSLYRTEDYLNMEMFNKLLDYIENENISVDRLKEVFTGYDISISGFEDISDEEYHFIVSRFIDNPELYEFFNDKLSLRDKNVKRIQNMFSEKDFEPNKIFENLQRTNIDKEKFLKNTITNLLISENTGKGYKEEYKYNETLIEENLRKNMYKFYIEDKNITLYDLINHSEYLICSLNIDYEKELIIQLENINQENIFLVQKSLYVANNNNSHILKSKLSKLILNHKNITFQQKMDYLSDSQLISTINSKFDKDSLEDLNNLDIEDYTLFIKTLFESLNESRDYNKEYDSFFKYLDNYVDKFSSIPEFIFQSEDLKFNKKLSFKLQNEYKEASNKSKDIKLNMKKSFLSNFSKLCSSIDSSSINKNISELIDSRLFTLEELYNLIFNLDIETIEDFKKIMLFGESEKSFFGRFNITNYDDLKFLNSLPDDKNHSYNQEDLESIEKNDVINSLNDFYKKRDDSSYGYSSSNYTHSWNMIAQRNDTMSFKIAKENETKWIIEDFYKGRYDYGTNLIGTYTISNEVYGKNSHINKNTNAIEKHMANILSEGSKSLLNTKFLSNLQVCKKEHLITIHDILKLLQSLKVDIENLKEDGINKLFLFHLPNIEKQLKVALEDSPYEKVTLNILKGLYNEDIYTSKNTTKKYQNSFEKMYYEFSYTNNSKLDLMEVRTSTFLNRLIKDIENIEGSIQQFEDLKYHSFKTTQYIDNIEILENILGYFSRCSHLNYRTVDESLKSDMKIIEEDFNSTFRDLSEDKKNILLENFSLFNNFVNVEEFKFNIDSDNLEYIANYTKRLSSGDLKKKLTLLITDNIEIKDIIKEDFNPEDVFSIKNVNRSLDFDRNIIQNMHFLFGSTLKDPYSFIYSSFDYKNINSDKRGIESYFQENFAKQFIYQISDKLEEGLTKDKVLELFHSKILEEKEIYEIFYFLFNLSEKETNILYSNIKRDKDLKVGSLINQMSVKELQNIFEALISNNYEITDNVFTSLFNKQMTEETKNNLKEAFVNIHTKYVKNYEIENETKFKKFLGEVKVKHITEEEEDEVNLIDYNNIKGLNLFFKDKTKENTKTINFNFINNSENNKHNILISDKYNKFSYVDFIEEEFFDGVVDFNFFLNKTEDIQSIYNSLVTPVYEEKYSEQKMLEIEELNIEIEELNKVKMEIERLKFEYGNVRSESKKEAIEEKLNLLNSEENNDKLKEINKKEDKLFNTWRTWYKDINTKLKIFDIATISGFENNLKEEDLSNLDSIISDKSFDIEVYEFLMKIFENGIENLSFYDFSRAKSLVNNDYFFVSLFLKQDIKDKEIIKMIIDDSSIEETYKNLKHFELKKYFKIKKFILDKLGEDLTNTGSEEDNNYVINSLIMSCNFDMNLIQKWVSFLKEFNMDINFLHHFNLDSLLKEDLKELLTYFKRVMKYLTKEKLKQQPDEDFGDKIYYMFDNKLKNVIHNIDYIREEYNTTDLSGAVIVNAVSTKQMNLDSEDMRYDLIYSLESANLTDNDNLSIDRNTERKLNELNNEIIEGDKFDIDKMPFLLAKNLTYSEKEDRWFLSEVIPTFDFRTFGQGFATNSCLTPNGLAKNILTEMSKEPYKWVTQLESYQKPTVKSNDNRFLELQESINEYNSLILKGIMDKELYNKIKFKTKNLFYMVAAGSQWNLENQATIDNMEVNQRKQVVVNGETVRVNIIDDNIIKNVNINSNNLIDYNKLKVLKDMKAHYEKFNTLSTFSMISSNYIGLVTIGSGYTDISVSDFSNIGNRGNLQENTTTYTDARRDQQYKVAQHEGFSLDSGRYFINYYENLKTKLDINSLNNEIMKLETKLEKNLTFNEHSKHKKLNKGLKKGKGLLA